MDPLSRKLKKSTDLCSSLAVKFGKVLLEARITAIAQFRSLSAEELKQLIKKTAVEKTSHKGLNINAMTYNDEKRIERWLENTHRCHKYFVFHVERSKFSK